MTRTQNKTITITFNSLFEMQWLGKIIEYAYRHGTLSILYLRCTFRCHRSWVNCPQPFNSLFEMLHYVINLTDSPTPVPFNSLFEMLLGPIRSIGGFSDVFQFSI